MYDGSKWQLSECGTKLETETTELWTFKSRDHPVHGASPLLTVY